MKSKRSVWKRLRQRMEAVICRIGLWICPRLPYPWLLALSKLGGLVAYAFASSERRVAFSNLEVAFGTQFSLRQRRRIVRSSFQSFARTGLESMASGRLLEDGLDRHFEFAPGSLSLLEKLVGQKRGLIALTFHYGNWEWLSFAWGMAGYPITAVAQRIKNPRVEDLIRANRQQCGNRLISRRGGVAPQLYKSLRRGEIIGLLVDLNSSIGEGGAFFDFFGLPVLTTRVVGLLARRTGAPIVCSVAHPQKNGRYLIEIGPEIFCDPNTSLEEEMNAVTARWMAHCESVIRARPECWMWMYKRWKVRATPESAGYPFYSFYDPKCAAPIHAVNRGNSTESSLL